MTPISLGQNISKTVGDVILQQSLITRYSAVKQYARLS